MWARVATIQIQPDKLEEFVDFYRESLGPAGRVQKGCKGVSLLADFVTSKVVSISLWETKEDLDASRSSGYLQEQIGKAAPTFVVPIVVENYEVTFQA